MTVDKGNILSWLKPKGDNRTWFIAVVLCALSIIEVYSASSRDTFAGKEFWETGLVHAGFTIIGLAITFLVSRVPSKLFKLFCPFGLIICIGMLVYLALGGGVTLNKATRWIEILGIRFQPSEISKICLIGTVASFLSTFRDRARNEATPRATAWAAGISMVVCLLILKENLSTALIIGFVILLMFWYARASLKWLSIFTVALIVMAAGSYSFLKYTKTETIERMAEVTHIDRLRTGHHRLNNKIVLPENPEDFVIGDYNTQEIHARIAVATGGLTGNGIGYSEQRDFLPMAFSDFIYSIIIEEIGFLGGACVMALYFWLLIRSWKIARRCEKLFPAYLVMGLSLMLVVQALINMSVCVGALPVTGQPLPLVSKGGTSTFMTCIYFGIILSVSHTAKRKEEYA